MNTLRHCRIASGFTLLEVLIAIVVVAFGLLGLAGLQLFALKNNQSASLRVAAVGLTSDIIDRMKSNYQGGVAGLYDKRDNTPANYNSPVPECSQASGCTPSDLAKNDLKQWRDRVAQVLPGGVGIVCIDSTPNDVAPDPDNPVHCDGLGTTLYAVKIWWVDDRTATNPGGTPKYVYTSFNP